LYICVHTQKCQVMFIISLSLPSLVSVYFWIRCFCSATINFRPIKVELQIQKYYVAMSRKIFMYFVKLSLEKYRLWVFCFEILWRPLSSLCPISKSSLRVSWKFEKSFWQREEWHTKAIFRQKKRKKSTILW
jgi:hypothetical protein